MNLNGFICNSVVMSCGLYKETKLVSKVGPNQYWRMAGRFSHPYKPTKRLIFSSNRGLTLTLLVFFSRFFSHKM